MSDSPASRLLANRCVETLRVRKCATTASVRNTKIYPKSQTHSNTHRLVAQPQTTGGDRKCEEPVTAMRSSHCHEPCSLRLIQERCLNQRSVALVSWLIPEGLLARQWVGRSAVGCGPSGKILLQEQALPAKIRSWRQRVLAAEAKRQELRAKTPF